MKVRKVNKVVLDFKPIVVELIIESAQELRFLRGLTSDGHYLAGVLANRTHSLTDREVGYDVLDKLKEVLG